MQEHPTIRELVHQPVGGSSKHLRAQSISGFANSQQLMNLSCVSVDSLALPPHCRSRQRQLIDEIPNGVRFRDLAQINSDVDVMGHVEYLLSQQAFHCIAQRIMARQGQAEHSAAQHLIVSIAQVMAQYAQGDAKRSAAQRTAILGNGAPLFFVVTAM